MSISEQTRYVAERFEGTQLAERSPYFPTLADAIRWALAAGDGAYLAGPECRWGEGVDGTNPVEFVVQSGAVRLPERTDWERVRFGSGRVRQRLGHPIPARLTLYVIEPGELSREGLIREPGVCLARAVRSGDRILDVLSVDVYHDRLEVTSERQSKNHYDWTPDGPQHNPDRRHVTAVRIGGRAGGWGALGDDTYSDAAADEILSETLVEAVLGTKDWQIAPIYYDTREMPAGDRSVTPWGVVAVVDLAAFRCADHQDFDAAGLVAESDRHDRRALDILEGRARE